jgi:glucan-binding YG repeat protein
MTRKSAKKSKQTKPKATTKTSAKKPAKKTAAPKKPAAKKTAATKPAARKPATPTPTSSLGSSPEKIAKLGLVRTTGEIYFIKENEVWRMYQGKTEKVLTAEFEREDGWLYFLDGDGDISRAKSNQPVVERGRYDEIDE